MSAANIELVQRLYASYASGDIDSVLEGCSPEIEWCSGGNAADFPAFGPRKGRAEVHAFFGVVADALEFNEFAPLEFYADKDKVIVLGMYTFTMKNGGQKGSSDWAHIFTVRDGKVTMFREFLDTARVAAAYRR